MARHVHVSLPEHLRHALELSAHLDEAVQLDARSPASEGEALYQRLRKLGAEIVAHLSEGLVELGATDSSRAVSVILLEQRSPPLHEIPQR